MIKSGDIVLSSGRHNIYKDEDWDPNNLVTTTKSNDVLFVISKHSKGYALRNYESFRVITPNCCVGFIAAFNVKKI